MHACIFFNIKPIKPNITQVQKDTYDLKGAIPKIPRAQYCWSIFQDIQKYGGADFNIPAGRVTNWYCKATLDVSLGLPRFYSNEHPYTPVARGNWNRRKSLVVFPLTRPRRSATQILLRRASIHFVRYHFVYHSRILKSPVWCGYVSGVVSPFIRGLRPYQRFSKFPYFRKFCVFHALNIYRGEIKNCANWNHVLFN